jgi:hypothetical protein
MYDTQIFSPKSLNAFSFYWQSPLLTMFKNEYLETENRKVATRGNGDRGGGG